MFNITFYQFDKKENSTARPSTGGAVFQCVLKEPTNIVTPDILLQFNFTTIPKFNYCHIPEFDRYYFVRNWTALNGGRWVASLKCDVLATYKNVIGGKSFLIERSSEEFDGYLTDMLYPATLDTDTSYLTFDPKTANGAWEGVTFPDNLNGGCFILSISNGENSGFSYYRMNKTQFCAFKNKLYDTNMSWYNFGTIPDGVAKTIADPFQYVHSCLWFPVSPWVYANPQNIQFGFWDSGAQGYKLQDNPYTVETFTITANTIPKHPQISRGAYLNNRPYTKYTLFMQPWGVFEINSDLIGKGGNIVCKMRVDYITGEALLTVEAVLNNEHDLLFSGSSMFGVPIPLTQRSIDFSGLGTMANALTNMNPFEAIAGMLGGAVQTAVSIENPTVTTKGSQGSIASITDVYRLYATFKPLTEEDLTRNGRPLMQNRTPASLGGYMSVVNADMTGVIGTDMERAELKDLMRSGFYYE